MKQTFALTETDSSFTVRDGDACYTVDRVHGVISSIVGNGKELLSSPIVPTIWRAPTDNDRNVKFQWFERYYHKMQLCTNGVSVQSADGDEIRVAASLALGAPARRPLVRMETVYVFRRGQGVAIEMDVKVGRKDAFLPRFGVEFRMPADCEALSYFGRGPVESYEDKKQASRVGLYRTEVTEHFEHYVRPQENMAHTETRWVEVSNRAGQGLLALNTETTPTFSFNCSHFTTQQLTETAHDYELTPLAETVVHLDWKHSGIGSDSCGPVLDESLRLNAEEFRFAVKLLPVLKNNVCPFERAVK